MKKPELSTDNFSAYLQEPTDVDRKYAKDAYSHLAAFCFLAYSAEHDRLQSGGVRHGFSIVARLIRCAANLYPEHAETSNEPAETRTLKEILLNSADTPARFANMPNGMNRVVEAYFGLRGDILPKDARELYKFEPTTERGTLFITDDEAFYNAVRQAEVESPMTTCTAGNKCPMMHVVREEIWPRMVTLAAEAPELITRDLQLSKSVA
jgi:hypothetical protein